MSVHLSVRIFLSYCHHVVDTLSDHTDCQNIGDTTFARLGLSSIAWVCSKCNNPNYSSVAFDLHGIDSNSFSILDESIQSIGSIDSQEMNRPKHASSPIRPRPQAAKCPRPLRIINVNCQSFLNKKPAFFNLIESFKLDIIIATETWFSSKIYDAEYFNAAHYTVHRRDRGRETPGGGVLVAVNNDFLSTREETLESETSEIIWLKIAMKGYKNLYIGCCYRPKIDDTTFLDNLSSSLQQITSKDSSSALIGGDFNLPGWDWPTNSLKSKTPYPSIHNKFGDIINDNGLTQIVNEPTRLGNILDLIITNRPNQVNRTQILPSISDHSVVYSEFDMNPTRRRQSPRKIPLMNKANWAGFKEFISNLGEEIMQAISTDNADTELLWQMFKGKIEQGIKMFIPSKTTKSKDSHPWIDRDIDRKMKQRDRAFTRSNKTGREKDEKRFQQLKHEVQRDERQAYWSYVKNLITPKEEDHEYSGLKRFYKFIKHKKTDINGVAPLKVDGKLVTEPKDKAEALNYQFQSVFSHETIVPTDNESSHQQVT